MKIGFPCFVMDGGKSGIGTYIINLLKSLQEKDIFNQYDIFLNDHDVKLIPINRSNFHLKTYSHRVNKPFLNIPWHHLILPYLEWKNGYDLIHIPTIRRIPFVKCCKMVATIHDLAPLIFPEKYGPLRHLYFSKILVHLVHRCDRIIAVSHNTKADIVRFTGFPEDKIDVIYSGIDTLVFRPIGKNLAFDRLLEKYKIKSEFILYVSRIEHPGKNHLNLIKAFELFKKNNKSDHQLILVGADWNGAEVVKQLASESPFKDDIIFLGYIPNEDVALMYNACDLMVFPSLYEGFGFPVIEAMACGAPVICSNISSLQELAEGHAETFAPDQYKEISLCLQNGLSSSYKEKFVQKGIAYAKSFDWQVAATEVLRVYESVVRS